MTKIKVNSGVCGFMTQISAESEDGQIAAVEIISACALVNAFAGNIKELDAFAECFCHFDGSKVYESAKNANMHTACPVPCAVIKCIEAECGLALPKAVSIEFEG